MTTPAFDTLAQIVKERRTTKPGAMNGTPVADELIEKLLELGTWAPTHGKTEPWQFIVYSGAGLATFGKLHAEVYWNNTPEDKRLHATLESLQAQPLKASHVILTIMKRGANPRIPLIEEIAAASAAAQNILLGAQALGLAAIWSTGGMTLTHGMKAHYQLAEEDHILGLLYIGNTDEPAKPGSRTPVAQKATFVNS